VVDYKTDTDAAGAAAHPAYAEQVRAYAEAWEKVSGETVKAEIVSARRP
jgi:ATP-dependent exoDNAse (exonuclease V) beta subunit